VRQKWGIALGDVQIFTSPPETWTWVGSGPPAPGLAGRTDFGWTASDADFLYLYVELSCTNCDVPK